MYVCSHCGNVVETTKSQKLDALVRVIHDSGRCVEYQTPIISTLVEELEGVIVKVEKVKSVILQ